MVPFPFLMRQIIMHNWTARSNQFLVTEADYCVAKASVIGGQPSQSGVLDMHILSETCIFPVNPPSFSHQSLYYMGNAYYIFYISCDNRYYYK